MHLFFKSLAGALDDRDVLDDAGDGVRVLKISLKVLMKISSRSNIRNLAGAFYERNVLDDVGGGVRVLKIPLGSSSESFIKIQHQKPSQDCTYPPSL